MQNAGMKKKRVVGNLPFSLAIANTGKKEFLSKIWKVYREIHRIDLRTKEDEALKYEDFKNHRKGAFLTAPYEDVSFHEKQV